MGLNRWEKKIIIENVWSYFFVLVAAIGIFTAIILPRLHRKSAHMFTKDVPAEVIRFCVDENGRIAEAGDDWQATDVIFDKSLPKTRFLEACLGRDGSWLISFEHGGHAYQVFILRVAEVRGKWKVLKKENFPDKPILDCGKLTFS